MIKFNKLTKKHKIIAAGVVAVMVLSLIGAYFSGREEVTVQAVALRDVQKMVEESGSVESKSAVAIIAKGSGTVSQILVQEGQSVNQGDLLVSFSDFSSASDVASIRAQAEGVYAQYLASKILSDNNKMLYEQGAISYMEYNQSLAVTQQLAAQLASLGYSAQSVSNATAAEGITTPIAGTVTAVNIKEGEWVGPGTPIAEVGRLDDRIIVLHLIAADADLVSPGMKASVFSEGDLITEDALVQEVALKATDYISSLGIIQKRVVVEVSLPKDVAPRLGSNADVEIIVQARKQVLSVPSKAVFNIEEQNYVYVADKGKAVLTPVEIDLEGEEYTEITGGLSEGMKVIVSPSTDIGDGARIKEKQ